MTAQVQHNLPAEPNRFVGRARDVAELCALVRGERVVTLSGVGGIGKTRLSLRVASGPAPCPASPTACGWSSSPASATPS